MYCEHWTCRDIAEAVFACVTNMEYRNGSWVEADEYDSEMGRDVYFDAEVGDCYRSNCPASLDDKVVFSGDVENMWLYDCGRNGWLVDEEWRDCESAIDWIEEEIDNTFGEGNDFFIRDNYDDLEEMY